MFTLSSGFKPLKFPGSHAPAWEPILLPAFYYAACIPTQVHQGIPVGHIEMKNGEGYFMGLPLFWAVASATNEKQLYALSSPHGDSFNQRRNSAGGTDLPIWNPCAASQPSETSLS